MSGVSMVYYLYHILHGCARQQEKQLASLLYLARMSISNQILGTGGLCAWEDQYCLWVFLFLFISLFLFLSLFLSPLFSFQISFLLNRIHYYSSRSRNKGERKFNRKKRTDEYLFCGVGLLFGEWSLKFSQVFTKDPPTKQTILNIPKQKCVVSQ